VPTVERIETWRGQDVLDGAGEKAGRLEEVYYDSNAEEPILLLVKHGLLGRQVILIPVDEAVVCHDYLRVPYSTEQIKRAQSSGVDDELNSEQVRAIGDLFNVTLASSGPLYSWSLIERRRVEAERARQRAHEMELEAERRAEELARRAEELKEARRRAGEAAEEAQAAERAREKADAAVPHTDPQRPPEQ
jgi:hypothetical protein